MFIESIFTYKDLGFLFYDESIFDVDDLLLIDKVSIVIDIYLMNKTLFLYIQFIHVIIILRNIRKFLEFKDCESD